MESNRVPLVNDAFWDEDYSAPLHAPTVLARIRFELSQERLEPITIAEVLQAAQDEMGYYPGACIFAEGEVGRPLTVVAAVWGFRLYGMTNDRARSFGNFVGASAGGDAILGPAADRLEKKAGQMLAERLGRKAELSPTDTQAFLDEVIQLYQGA